MRKPKRKRWVENKREGWQFLPKEVALLFLFHLNSTICSWQVEWWKIYITRPQKLQMSRMQRRNSNGFLPRPKLGSPSLAPAPVFLYQPPVLPLCKKGDGMRWASIEWKVRCMKKLWKKEILSSKTYQWPSSRHHCKKMWWYCFSKMYLAAICNR